MSDTYAFEAIEPKWQQRWEDAQAFGAANPGQPGAEKPKFYILDFFPYPSGAGLHVGHPLGYIASDIISRFKRMRGFNVLHPMGWDAFGLPAEQYAVETGVHPRITTQKNIETYKRQMNMIGLGYDWSRETATCDEDYYRWTQWIFLKIFNSWYDPDHRWTDSSGRSVVGAARSIDELPIPEDVASLGQEAVDDYRDEHRLAFLSEVPVNWCPALGTVLSNEEVTNDGKSDRGNHPVYRRPMRQWMLRITDYADRLLSDLDELDWPEPIKLMQRNWIGRSNGAYADFTLEEHPADIIRVFTTRPDTLFGATYLVLAPEHRLVSIITKPERRQAVDAYVDAARQKSELDRTADAKEKTGVFTGAYAINPVNKSRVPIWVADYVLISYGTGSIMSVPAHDTRDYEFAKEFNIPIVDVIYPPLLAAMKYFVEHAPADARTDEHWRGRLAALLGRAGGVDKPELLPDLFADAMSDDNPNADVVYADEFIKQLPGDIERKLGASKVAWSDVFDALGFQNFDQFRQCFEQAAFFSRTGEAFTGDGRNVNSPREVDFDDQCRLNGLDTPSAKKAITDWLAKNNVGEGTIQYKLRDWLFSRQRYWGEPFPVLYRDDGRIVAESENNLPVALPRLEDYRPHASDDPDAEPQTPLSRAPDEWIHVQRDGRTLRRELNTMPQWAGSCWYYLRFCDAQNDQDMISRDAEKYWLGGVTPQNKPQIGGVDLYMGGAEHAVLHLLYARFWHKVLYDLGHVSTPEPFHKLFNQGMIQSYAFQREDGIIVARDSVIKLAGSDAASSQILSVSEDEQLDDAVVEIWEKDNRRVTDAVAKRLADKGEAFIDAKTGAGVSEIVAKMSKSLKNVINPDSIIHEYGADTLRLYEMYMGPLEASKPWNTRDIIGVHRFLQRVWRLVVTPDVVGQDPGGPWNINPKITDQRDEDLERLLHKTIKKVQEDIERFAMNTAIAQMIVWSNAAQKAESIHRDQIERFLCILAPLAPHICEELWERLGAEGLIAVQPWPDYDEKLVVDDAVEIAVQIKGKVKARITVPADAGDDQIIAAAKADEKIAAEIAGKDVKRAIVVKGRLVNLIV